VVEKICRERPTHDFGQVESDDDFRGRDNPFRLSFIKAEQAPEMIQGACCPAIGKI